VPAEVSVCLIVIASAAHDAVGTGRNVLEVRRPDRARTEVSYARAALRVDAQSAASVGLRYGGRQLGGGVGAGGRGGRRSSWCHAGVSHVGLDV